MTVGKVVEFVKVGLVIADIVVRVVVATGGYASVAEMTRAVAVGAIAQKIVDAFARVVVKHDGFPALQ